MVSTLKFHALKEIDFSKRKPFWILVAFVLVIAIMVIHPAIALFVLAMIYLAEGLLENIYLYYRKRKTADNRGQTMRKIKIFDTTLRDGEQSPGASMNVEEKLQVARQLVRLGVDIIEAGFPIASPGDFDAVRRIATEVNGATIAALARAKEEDIRRAWEAIKDAPQRRIHTFHSTSDIHLKYQYRISREEALKRSVEMVRLARSLVDDVEFSPMDATRTDTGYLLDVVAAVIEAGAGTVNIPDTVGYTSPSEFGELIRTIKERIGDSAVISVHCHDDLGLSVANSLAAVLNGAGQVECTINGIGERAGNCSMEEVVMALKTRRDFFDAETEYQHQGDHPDQQAYHEDNRDTGAAQQGDRRGERVRSRVRHTSGRPAEGEDDL